MSRLLREPLFHFILIGLVVFAGNAVLQSRSRSAEQTIHVTLADAERLAAIWAGEAGRVPTAEDIAGLVADHVREEALYREAQRLGLDRDDTIIRRRLAQKMRFMMDDTSAVIEPDEMTLKAAFEAAPEKYASASKLSFSHVYLSPETRGDAIEADGEAILLQLRADDSDWRGTGDAFMLPRQFGDVSTIDVTRLFGKVFSDALFASEGEGWIGPFGSAFGLHLVRIESRSAGEPAVFESVRAQVLADYMKTARREANATALAKIMGRYSVEIEGVE